MQKDPRAFTIPTKCGSVSQILTKGEYTKWTVQAALLASSARWTSSSIF